MYTMHIYTANGHIFIETFVPVTKFVSFIMFAYYKRVTHCILKWVAHWWSGTSPYDQSEITVQSNDNFSVITHWTDSNQDIGK